MLQLYCLSLSFLINNTANCSSEFFWGGDILRLFKPVVWEELRGFIQLPPCFLEEHVLVLWLLILISSLFSSSSFLMEGMKPPLYRQWGSLSQWVGAFHIREVDRCCHSSWHGVTYPFHSPLCYVWPCLPWPSSVSGHIHCEVHYPPASLGIDIIPSALCMCSFWGLQPHHITWGLHPSLLDAPVGIHSRSHNFPFFHPREALLVGHRVTTLPLFSFDILFSFTSCRGSLAWSGTGTPVPCMTAAHTQGNVNLQCNKKKSVSVEDSWPPVLLHHFVRGDVCCNLMHHLPSLFFPPILDLPLSPKSISLD